MTLSCRSIKNKVENVITKEKGSKFIGFAYPIETELEAQNYLKILHEKYSDATHICYAYRLGYEGNIYRANDDGEPNGTAGVPIYNQIRSADITNVLVVSVRYFGGTKLGVGGLIQAYKTSAELTLSRATIIKYIRKSKFSIDFEYTQQNIVSKILDKLDANIINQHFSHKVHFEFEFATNLENQIDIYFEPIQHLISLKKLK